MNWNKFLSLSPKHSLILISLIFSAVMTILITLTTSATSFEDELALLGTSPEHPAPLVAGLNRGRIDPHTTYWYSFQFDDFSGQHKFRDLAFTLFATPSDGNLQHHINFYLYPYGEINKWQRGEGHLMSHFGAGMLVSRDGDDLTAERLWRGTVIMGDLYLLAIKNDTDFVVDFALYDADVNNIEFGPYPEPPPAPAEPVPTPAPIIADGFSPATALPLEFGVNKGSLPPGQEIWYSFSITDFDDEFFEEMDLTMITTPDDGNRIHYMVFNVYAAGDLHDWQPGMAVQERSFGAGSLVYRDQNPWTGERFWTGWLIDNDQYLLQIRNGTEVQMDYWLFTEDVYGPELD